MRVLQTITLKRAEIIRIAYFRPKAFEERDRAGVDGPSEGYFRLPFLPSAEARDIPLFPLSQDPAKACCVFPTSPIPLSSEPWS